jgi:hypothetical protein
VTWGRLKLEVIWLASNSWKERGVLWLAGRCVFVVVGRIQVVKLNVDSKGGVEDTVDSYDGKAPPRNWGGIARP